ncbi:MAG: DMT family transporter [Hyphomicrobiaceae bacterium]|nr:MAG: DMT family transporter [Hyphomicrobiaceae bacterium]
MGITSSLHSRSENLQGIAAMLLAMAAFVSNDTLVKLASRELPTGEAIFVRGMFASLIAAGLVAASYGARALPVMLSRTVVLRGLADVFATMLFITALVHMPIGDANAILQFTPLAVTAAAALFLGAPVGWRRWLATLVGLAGVLIIVRPGAAGFNAYAPLAVLSILFVVARDLLTRRLGAEVRTLLVVCSSCIMVMLGSLGLAAFEDWRWPPHLAVLALFGASLGLLAGHYWIIVAMRSGEIAVVAPFRYSIILWAILSGFLIWGEIPDLGSWGGIAIVTAAGLYTFVRERRLAQAARS